MRRNKHVLPVVTFLSSLVGLAGRVVLGGSPDAEPVRVGRWQLWEQSLQARASYRNPFTDVRVTTMLVSPSGKSVEREGFYDGEHTWRLRYAPDAVGRWHWTSRAHPEDAGLATSGTFECIGSDVHGPLRVNAENSLWFTYADSTPVYLLAFHIWRSDVLEESTLAQTLDFAKNRGFNGILSPHLESSHMAWERTAEGKPGFSQLNLAVWRGLRPDPAFDRGAGDGPYTLQHPGRNESLASPARRRWP